MDVLIWIIAATVLDSLVGLVGIFSLWMKEDAIRKLSIYLMAFSAGALLGGAFFHLLPEALAKTAVINVAEYIVLGFIVFQLMETYLHWHLCKECDVHPYSYMMTIGDGLHNIVDGLVIAASFLVSVPFGILTTVMIIVHEVPQEMGIFGTIVHGGQKPRTAILYSFIAQTTCILGGIGGYFLSQSSNAFAGFLIPFAAGGFLYIVATDLVPEMHKSEGWERMKTFAVYIVGLAMMVALKLYVGGA
ncbi:Zinc transporter ZupT [uncultured archaeon]|nr:Zinc transporter ZupT [uncultured archaeon]